MRFDQPDYFKLVYSPEHHHFVRHFAVIFDVAIAGTCGLEILNLAKPGVTRPARAFAIDCQLGRLREAAITSVVF